MKITTFNPLIVSSHAEDIIKLFEEMGFEVRHTKKDLDSVASTDCRMRYTAEDSDKVFHVDVVQIDGLPRDMTQIRMNVDNFEEAYNLLTAHGFTSNRKDGSISEDKTGKGVGMVSPSGFSIAVIEHKKDK